MNLNRLRRLSVALTVICLVSQPPALPAAPRSYYGVKNAQLKTPAPASYKTCPLFDTTSPLEVRVKQGDRLYAAYAVRSDPAASLPCEFEVLVNGDAKAPLFRRTMDPTKSTRDRGWKELSAPLDAWAGKTIRLEFVSWTLENGVRRRSASNGPGIWGAVRIGTKRKPREPNLIIVSLDTLRGDRLGFAGYKRPTSPNLDKLAKAGVWFTHAIAQSPWTKPSHMSIFTGLLPSRHGQVKRNTLDRGRSELPENIPTLAEILSKEGYLTHAVTGSAYVAAKFGFARGFDRYIESADRFRGDGPFVFRLGNRWLEKHAREKFFLFLHTYEVHEPYRHDRFVTPGMDRKEVLNAQYDSGIRFVDGLVGSLQATLQRAGIEKETLIVILSDHGEELLEHGFATGHGHSLYEDQLRVPLVFYWPGKLTPNNVDGVQAQHIDIMPTILDLLGIEAGAIKMDGRSLKPFLTGEKKREDSVAIAEAVEYGAIDQVAVRVMNSGIYKLIVSPSVARGKPIRTDNNPPSNEKQFMKYWRQRVLLGSGKEFYNLKTDPGEKKDLSEKAPNPFRSMEEILQNHLQQKPKVAPRSEIKNDPAIDEELKEKMRSLGY